MARTLRIEPLGRTITVEEHQTLLEAALAQKAVSWHHCARTSSRGARADSERLCALTYIWRSCWSCQSPPPASAAG